MIDELRLLLYEGKITYTKHALRRMLERGISRNEVKGAIKYGQIIKAYPDDR
ncbi:hypothetical protein AGMMS49992_27570 [Clostridia bacterium]|nr:hypothetical protein AGMMS49992_27570 [Clostridia bacterium]